MKINLKNIFCVVASAAALTACIGDLDSLPLSKDTVTADGAYTQSEAAYVQGLAKIYMQLISNNTQDLQVADGGASEMLRAFWSTQEVTADACKCAWGDAWVQDLNNNTWTATALNDAVYAVYVRTLQGVSYANEYLRQTDPALLAEKGASSELINKVESFRAEARFLRAYFYWMALDAFGDVPFTTEATELGGALPKQLSRAELFNFCVRELEELAAEGSPMPEARSNYPRTDKGSCLGLLARMYLNAEVYTTVKDAAGAVVTPGTKMFDKAKLTCERIYKLGYSLAPTHAEIFRGDNGENPDARKEMLFVASYNAEKSQSYGGTSYLSFAAIEAEIPNTIGINNGWGGIRVPFDYVNRYFGVEPESSNYNTGEYKMTDKRGQYFYIKGRTESMEDNIDDFKYGWSYFKFNNIPHDKTAEEFKETAATKAYSDIDYPIIRLGEIHLIYAEACMHEGGSAAAQLAELSERAGVNPPATVDQAYLEAERARELMWEGHRRTDLVRYGLFSGNIYTWTYKGGSFQGQGIAPYMDIFPIPPTEMKTNPELHQNPGYNN